MAKVVVDGANLTKLMFNRHNYRLDAYYYIDVITEKGETIQEEHRDSYTCFSYYDVLVFKGKLSKNDKYYKFVVIDLDYKAY